MAKIVPVGVGKINYSKLAQDFGMNKLVIKRCPDCGTEDDTSPDGKCPACGIPMRNFCSKCRNWQITDKCPQCEQDGIQSTERVHERLPTHLL